jgi:hypothetical protein
MKKLIAFLLALLLLPAMTGCSAMLEREYSSQTPHAEQEPPPEANFTLEADTYQKLVIGILYFVNRHMETGTIRFSNFEGDIDEAVQTACLEVTRSDPIGAFVVDYITSDVVRIVSYYEADLTIVYKHPQTRKNMSRSELTMKGDRSALKTSPMNRVLQIRIGATNQRSRHDTGDDYETPRRHGLPTRRQSSLRCGHCR